MDSECHPNCEYDRQTKMAERNVIGSLSSVNVDNLWTINNFSNHLNAETNEFLRSPYFHVDKYKWNILLYMNDVGIGPQDFITVLINVKMERPFELRTQIKFSLINSRNEEINIKNSRHGKLVIRCNLAFLDQTVNLPSDKRTLTDVKLHTANGEDIHAHKAILAANSPVFYAMFQHDTTENQENVIKIADCDFDALTELIRFMYTGTIRNLENIAQDLLVTAGKYNMKELKLLTLKTVLDYIFMLRLHKFTDLEEDVRKYIHENIKDAIYSTEFISMKQEYPNLLLDLLCYSVEMDD
ncbi:hypothetical protein TSAR_007886 [Trichomalopsis sarcophagae]|uniref:BTB domain-containing protein n=1 Tax=Trichomalopsis sarcophagae TaxID=543379 RepID=A0A232F8K3_9HYME|nr:hypothetical protein TSAR_007886 [Trichomalopsis sarcophagae]